MKDFRTKLPRAMAEGLHSIIEAMLTNEFDNDEDKLIMAALAEIKHRLYQKLERSQSEYIITFSPVQAIALRLLYTEYAGMPESYMGIRLFQLSNEIHRHYS